MILSRKGALGGGILYFVFFLMIIIIAGGIFGGMISFFGEGYDYRKVETLYLSKQVKDCFTREGFFELKAEIDKDAFFEKCKINSKVIEDGNHLVYVKNRNNVEFFAGVSDYKNRCFLKFRNKNKDLPLCTEYKTEQGDYVLVGSSQNSKRVLS